MPVEGRGGRFGTGLMFGPTDILKKLTKVVRTSKQDASLRGAVGVSCGD